MKILGIDTSTSCGSVGLTDDRTVISDYLLNCPVTHSERLLRAVEFILKEARCPIEEVDGWAITLGPGSFTGLRIGASTIKGLAFVTKKPVAGVSTLDALASQIAPTPYSICPILDARKKEVYAALYRYQEDHSLKRHSDDQALRPEDLVEKIKERTIFVGEGIRTYGDFLARSLSSLAFFAPMSSNVLHGSTVAKLGFELLQKGKFLDLATFAPLYVRPSEAEVKFHARRAGLPG